MAITADVEFSSANSFALASSHYTLASDQEPMSYRSFLEPSEQVVFERYPWLIQALILNRSGQTVESLDLVYDHLDALLFERQWESVNMLLGLNPEWLPTSLNLAFLTLTAPAVEHLPKRSGFRSRTEDTLYSRNEMEPGLLDGL